jgi:hypothetical protein
MLFYCIHGWNQIICRRFPNAETILGLLAERVHQERGVGAYNEKIEKGWELAERLHETKDFNNCASRVYYSVFQSVLQYAIQNKKYDPAIERQRKNAHREMSKIVNPRAALGVIGMTTCVQ